MADKTPEQASAPKKQRWYNNFIDAYKLTARVYKWLPYAMIGIAVLLIGGAVAFALWRGLNVPMWVVTGVLASLLACMVLLTNRVKPALYSQLEGKVGSVYAVTQNIKKGWIVDEQPIAANKDQDLVWRLVGRPGVVFIAEGPHSRVASMLGTERRRIEKVAKNVPVTTLEVGTEDGQLSLTSLEKELKRLKKVLTKEEVPAVSARLNAVRGGQPPIPKGVDPMKARPNRRAMRGR